MADPSRQIIADSLTAKVKQFMAVTVARVT